ncbi:MAG: DUF4276 family protein [Gammaproteobacteria bacterium]|nr:DUF4276 family protein [Gammaproteobacteria bacterium]
MTMMLVFFLEERSAKEFLEGFLPRVLPDGVLFKCIAFEGKQDLEKHLKAKIQGWRMPNTCFVVLRDQDSANCIDVKQRLKDICVDAGRPDTLVRIVCHELESWFLGNLLAVEQALGLSGLAKKQQQKKFKNPDLLANASEELEKLTGYEYTKVAGSRALGFVMSQHSNCSTSFNHFVSGLLRHLEVCPQ